MFGGAANPYLNDPVCYPGICLVGDFFCGLYGISPFCTTIWENMFGTFAKHLKQIQEYQKLSCFFSNFTLELNSGLKPSNVADSTETFLCICILIHMVCIFVNSSKRLGWGFTPKKWPSNMNRRRPCLKNILVEYQTSRYRTSSSLYPLLLMAVQSLLQLSNDGINHQTLN